MSDLIRTNGVTYGWQSCSMKIDLMPVRGILEFKYEDSRERKIVRGMDRSGKGFAKTPGRYDVTACSLKMLRDTWEEVSNYLTLKGLGSYGDAVFGITFQVSELIAGVLPITVQIDGCTIDKVSEEQVEGVDELATSIDCSALGIVRNGKVLYSVARAVI